MKRQKQNLSQFPTLITDRLILRKLEKNDAAEIFKIRSDERVNQYIDRPKAITIKDALEFINKIEAGINDKEWFYWAISLSGNSKLIGAICLWNVDKENASVEIGYELHPDFQKQGLMQEAFSKIIEFGFGTLKFKTITAFSNPANKPSITLLEKNNFVRDMALENEYYSKEDSGNEVIYSLKSPSVG